MRKIIVPTDFSDGAYNALKHAVEIAKAFNGSIDVIHAFSMPSAGSTVMVDISEMLEKNAKEEVVKLKTRMEGDGLFSQINFQFKAEHGSVVDVVRRHAKEKDSDMVVMGTHGASGFSEKWLGTNSAAVARNMDLPTLVVPSTSPYKPVKEILFATDMKVSKDETPFEVLAMLCNQFDSKTRFVHITDGSKEQDFSEYKSQVARIIGKDYSSFEILENDNVENGINQAIEEFKPDLMVAVRHSYDFFTGLFHSSVTQQIIQTAALPVLVMKA